MHAWESSAFLHSAESDSAKIFGQRRVLENRGLEMAPTLPLTGCAMQSSYMASTCCSLSSAFAALCKMYGAPVESEARRRPSAARGSIGYNVEQPLRPMLPCLRGCDLCKESRRAMMDSGLAHTLVIGTIIKQHLVLYFFLGHLLPRCPHGVPGAIFLLPLPSNRRP